jgi:hypothetical protein
VEAHHSLRTGADQGNKMQEKETLDERLPSMFEPDTLLPIQYFEAMRKKHLLEGEKRLILSVLEDAVECFMKCIEASTNKGQRLFREADEWINHEDKRWVFSFDNVCDMLDINPAYMRVGLRRWKERKIEAIARRRAMEAELAAATLANPEPPALVEVAAPAPQPVKVFAKPVPAVHHKHERRTHAAHASVKRRSARA